MKKVLVSNLAMICLMLPGCSGSVSHDNGSVAELSHLWIIASDYVRPDNPHENLPRTRIFLDTLTAMSNAKVVYIGLGGQENKRKFDEITDDKILVTFFFTSMTIGTTACAPII